MQFLQKETTKKCIIAIVYLCLGVVLCFFPSQVKIFVCYVFGGLLIAAGIIRIISYYSKFKGLHSFMINGPLAGILSIIFGIFFICFSAIVTKIYPILIGAYFILRGIGKIVRSQAYRYAGISFWWFDLVVGLILCCFSIALIVIDVFKNGNLVVYLTAASLIVQGIINILNMVFLSANMDDLQKTFDRKANHQKDSRIKDDVIEVDEHDHE